MIGDRLPAYLNRKTGRLITISSDQLEATEAGDEFGSYFDWEQEAIQGAQDILNTDDYLRLSSKFDIHEYSIMERFCNEIEDAELSNELLFQIRGLGHFNVSNTQSIVMALWMIGIVTDKRYGRKLQSIGWKQILFLI